MCDMVLTPVHDPDHKTEWTYPGQIFSNWYDDYKAKQWQARVRVPTPLRAARSSTASRRAAIGAKECEPTHACVGSRLQEYWSRAWCRVEAMLAAVKPVINKVS